MTCGLSLRQPVLESNSGSAFVDPSSRSSVGRVEMFWKKKEAVKLEVPTVTANELCIDLSSKKGPLILNYAPWDGNNTIKPWSHFLKWYFSKDSPAYWLSTDTGGVMLLRRDITSFKIRVLEKKVEQGS